MADSPPSSRGQEPAPRTFKFDVCMNDDNGVRFSMQAHESNTLGKIHHQVENHLGISKKQQILTHEGQELERSSRLGRCSIQQGSIVYVTCQMQPKPINEVIQFMDGLIFDRCKCPDDFYEYLITQFRVFLDSITLDDVTKAKEQLDVFLKSSGPFTLSSLNSSQYCEIAYFCITGLVNKVGRVFRDDGLRDCCIEVLVQLCRFLRSSALNGGLYVDTLLVMSTVSSHSEEASISEEGVTSSMTLVEISKCAIFWANTLGENLRTSIASTSSESPLDDNVGTFVYFFQRWHNVVENQVSHMIPVSLPLDEKSSRKLPLYGEEIWIYHIVYHHLMFEIENGLKDIEELLATEDYEDVVEYAGRPHYLTMLRELHRATDILLNADQQFWEVMRRQKRALCALIKGHVTPNDDIYDWLVKHRDKLNFEVRSELSLLLFSEIGEKLAGMVEFHRSQLFTEAFAYVVQSEADSIKTGIDVFFENEEASGPGVLREWFCLVCKELFNQQNDLFLCCPNDRRRLYPNPASKAIPKYRDYFVFAGRMIALTLLHRIQVGILFDRSFVLQLSGKPISLSDIENADPIFHNSCKKIMEMEASVLGSDALALTFSVEVEELGSMKVVELCPGGEMIHVNSENKEKYINLLIQHHFVTSTAEQVAGFAEGFADILFYPGKQKCFFNNLEMKDLDLMLCGNEVPISVKEWKAHTVYDGYKETDPQILWFWKIVEEMSPKEKRFLLYYWISVNYLPSEDFHRLDKQLTISKVVVPLDHLPSSHTCLYNLCLPPYLSMDIMRDRLHVITQEHFCNGFGLA